MKRINSYGKTWSYHRTILAIKITMINKPLISIVIPIYNVEPYLVACLDSVLCQSYENFELILVDDGSTDSSAHICDSYGVKDERIVVINKANEGVSSARNVGTLAARGDYVTYVDGDDYWRGVEHLSNIMELIVSTDADVVCSAPTLLYSSGVEVKPAEYLDVQSLNCRSKREVLEYLITTGRYQIGAWSRVVRRELLVSNSIEFDVALVSAEDLDWSLAVDMCASRVVVYGAPFYIYRQGRVGSTTYCLGDESYESLLRVVVKWRGFVVGSSFGRAEKELYLGYLAYQYGVLLGLVARASCGVRGRLLAEMAECKDILKYSNSCKSRCVSLLYSYLGLRLTGRVLGLYVYLRRKGCRLL